jgi:hypothetical protein
VQIGAAQLALVEHTSFAMAVCEIYSNYSLPLPWRQHNTFLEFCDQEPECYNRRRSFSASPTIAPADEIEAAHHQVFTKERMSRLEEKKVVPSGKGSGSKRGGGLRRAGLAPDQIWVNARDNHYQVPLIVEDEPNEVYIGSFGGSVPEELNRSMFEEANEMNMDSLNVSAIPDERSTPDESESTSPGSGGTTKRRKRRQKMRQYIQDLECFEAKNLANPDGGTTTAMIRHIACRYTQEQVASFLDDIGLEGKYNCIYLPLNSTKRANLGYVFVNFLSVEYFEECRELLDNQILGPSQTEKRCQVTQAHLQGAQISRNFRRKAMLKERKKAERELGVSSGDAACSISSTCEGLFPHSSSSEDMVSLCNMGQAGMEADEGTQGCHELNLISCLDA